MKSVKVRMCDLRLSGTCWKGDPKAKSGQWSGGARQFLIDHGFDPVDFRRNGIDSEKLEKTGNAIALRIVEVARGRTL